MRMSHISFDVHQGVTFSELSRAVERARAAMVNDGYDPEQATVEIDFDVVVIRCSRPENAEETAAREEAEAWRANRLRENIERAERLKELERILGDKTIEELRAL